MRTPPVLRMYDVIKNDFVEIDFEIANKETPISSGRGEAIIKPARTGIKYFLIVRGFSC